MRDKKTMKKFTMHLPDYSYKSLMFYLFLFFGSLTVLSSGFVSCSSSNTGLNSGRDGADLDDDDDEGYVDCKTREECEDVCRVIYDESWEACNRKEMETVGQLQRVYLRLRQTRVKRSRLNTISEERDGIKLKHFEEYLNIGVDGWIKQIEGYETKEGIEVPSYTPEQAQEVIRWFADEENVAEVLWDISETTRVLETLLRAAVTAGSNGQIQPKSCFWKTTAGTVGAGVAYGTNPKVQFESSSRADIVIKEEADSNPPIELRINNAKYEDLYDLLSCSGVNGDTGSRSDIFSVAESENNAHLFNVAFRLLNQVCRNSILAGHDKEEEICRRAMMCVLAIQYMSSLDAPASTGSAVAEWGGWNYVEDHFQTDGFDKDQACDLHITSDKAEFGGNIDI